MTPKCADPNTMRWYCMRGHGERPVAGRCPLAVCVQRGANGAPETMVSEEER